MAAYKDGISVGVLVHGRFETTSQVLLEGGILNNRDAQSVVIAKHALTLAARNPLDLLDIADLKACVRALLPLYQKSHQDCPLRVCVDAASRTVLERSEEQRCTGGRVELEGLADVVTVFGGVLLSGPLDHEDVFGFHALLLDTGGSNEDVVAVTNGGLLHVSAPLRFLGARDLHRRQCQ